MGRGGLSQWEWRCLPPSYLLLWAEEAAHLSTVFHLVALVGGCGCAGHGRADDSGGQSDADLWSGAFGAQPTEHGLHDGLLQRSGGGVGPGDDCWVHWEWNGVCSLALGLIALAGYRMRWGIAAWRPLQGNGRRRFYGSLGATQ